MTTQQSTTITVIKKQVQTLTSNRFFLAEITTNLIVPNANPIKIK